jgi:hypothetical protein
MTQLQTLPETARYEELIKAATDDHWDIALYPPASQTHFDVGTVFSRRSDGILTICGGGRFDMVTLNDSDY